MTVKDFFNITGGDYEDTKSRISNEALLKKFLIQFLADKNFNILKDSLEEKNYEKAFCAVHSLKGVSANLGLLKLEKSSSDLSSYLRKNNQSCEIQESECIKLFSEISKDYEETVTAIKQL